MDLAQVAFDAAKGAAAGSVVPGIGTALGAAGAVALDIAPELGRWLFGKDAAPVTAAVQGAITAVTGATDPEAQLAALQDPATASALRIQLAAIAAQQANGAHQALLAQLTDVANARATTVQLAQAGSPMAWGAPVVSVVVLLTFGAVMSMVLFRTIPPGSETVLNVLLGTLGAMATSVVGYWVGSSVGSARKDDRLSRLEAEQ